MTVVLVIATLIILGAVVFLATGRGGELSAERPDYAPLDLGPLSATDVVLHRPPAAMWGYSMPATDEALERIAESIRERDVRIVALEQLVTDLSHDPAPALPRGSYVGHRRRADYQDAGYHDADYPDVGYQDAGYQGADYQDEDMAADSQSPDFPAAFERPRAKPARPPREEDDEPEQAQSHPVQWTRQDVVMPDPVQPAESEAGSTQPHSRDAQASESQSGPFGPQDEQVAEPDRPQQQGPPERSHG